MNGVTAIEFLAGISASLIVGLQLYILKRQGDQDKKLAGIIERLLHVPTHDELQAKIAKTRHDLRNEIQSITGDLDIRVDQLEKWRIQRNATDKRLPS